MKLLMCLLIVSSAAFAAEPPRTKSAKAQNTPQNKTVIVEHWLTKERAAQLRALTSRPYITKRADIGKGMAEYHWTSGNRSWVSTQVVHRVQGAKAAHGWQKKVDAEKTARKEILSDVQALAAKGNASQKDLEAIVEKAKEKGDVK